MIFAMFAVSMLTVLVGVFAVKARVESIKSGQLSPAYFSLMQGGVVPAEVIKTTRCFNNLFEVPVLFYVVCTLYLVSGVSSSVALVLAWAFFLLRCTQAYVHISYNNVSHRMLSFFLSLLCVVLLWVNLVFSL